MSAGLVSSEGFKRERCFMVGFFFYMFIFERKCEWGRGRERGRHMDAGLELENCEIMTQAKIGCLTN